MLSVDICSLLSELQKMTAAWCSWEAALNVNCVARLLSCPGDPAPFPSCAWAAREHSEMAHDSEASPFSASFLDTVRSLLGRQVWLLIHDETWGKLCDLQLHLCFFAPSSLWRANACYGIAADSAQ